jgi:hypothetical protein
MPDIIKCPLCQRQLQIDEGSYGQWFKCPSCGGTFQIAAAPPPARAPAKAPAVTAPYQRAPASAPVVPPRIFVEPTAPPQPSRPAPPVREDLNLQTPLSSGTGVNPHRGFVVLVLGFIALALFAIPPVGWILGGMAIAMGNDDLQRMQRGTMDRSGELLTLVGKMCGLLAVVLSTVALFWFLYIFFRGALGG